MAQIETWFAQDLLRPVSVQYISGNFFSQDNQGNKVGVRVTSGGEPVTLGGTISANVIRADGGTVAVSGSSSGNEAWVVLPEAAYLVPGILSIIIKCTDSGVVTTICACVTNVYQTTTDTVVDPGTVVSSIQDLIDSIDTAVASIPVDYSSLLTTLAPAFSTGTAYTAGQYVLYDGAIYKFTTDHAAGSWNSAEVVAANYGNDLSSLLSAIEKDAEGKYPFEIVNGEYVKRSADSTNGRFDPYSSWSRSNFIYCEGLDYVYVFMASSSNLQYNAFYSEKDDTTAISGFSVNGNTLTKVEVPTGAKYFVISNATSVIEDSYALSYENTEIKNISSNISDIENDISEIESDLSAESSKVTKLQNGNILWNEGKYPFDIIKGEYVKRSADSTNGRFDTYSSWSRSGFIYCEGLKYIYVFMASASDLRYNAFYSAKDDTTAISGFTLDGNKLTMVEVPAEAKYFVISNSTSVIENSYVLSYERIKQQEIQSQESYLQPISRQAYLLQKNEIPDYYLETETPTSFDEGDYLEQKIRSVPEGKHFIFITDPHVPSNAMYSCDIIPYLKDRLGIKTIVMGGDILNRGQTKYVAANEIESYTRKMVSALGDMCYLPVLGNHDLNTVPAPGETEADVNQRIIPYDILYSRMFLPTAPYVIPDPATKLDGSDFSFTSEQLRQLHDYMKMHYYSDDHENKIRYIVIVTGTTYSGIVKDLFDCTNNSEMWLEYDWFYNALMTVPEGYDVIVAGHAIVKYGTTSSPDSDEIVSNRLKFCQMLSALKTKGTVALTNTSENENVLKYYSAGYHSYDFANAPDVGTIFCVSGDTHWDCQVVTYYKDGSYVSEPIGQNQVFTDDAIMTIVTQTDAYNASKYPGQPYESKVHEMTLGTITEQCFDIVTIGDGVTFTRIGAGNDRHFNYS